MVALKAPQNRKLVLGQPPPFWGRPQSASLLYIGTYAYLHIRISVSMAVCLSIFVNACIGVYEFRYFLIFLFQPLVVHYPFELDLTIYSLSNAYASHLMNDWANEERSSIQNYLDSSPATCTSSGYLLFNTRIVWLFWEFLSFINIRQFSKTTHL